MVTLAILALSALIWLAARKGRGGPAVKPGDDPVAEPGRDPAARVAGVAATWLPPQRQEWGMAMAAELAQVREPARRWWFAAGVLRVALFPPPRHRARVLIVAGAGLAAVAAATVAAASEVPGMSVFTAMLGLLLCGYATAVAARWHRPRPTVPRVLVGAAALAGVTAAVTAVVRIGVAYPAAVTDRRHVLSVLAALSLAGYLVLALRPVRLGRCPDAALWWALGGALATGAAWSAVILATPAAVTLPVGFMPPAGAVAVAVTSAGAAAATRDRRAGLQAGLLAGLLGALVHFSVTLTAALQLHHYTLAGLTDIAGYTRSGYPSVTSYVLGDTLAGAILTGLVLAPLVLLAIAVLGAAAGTGLRQLAARPTAAR
jgi:hypothetical protein